MSPIVIIRRFGVDTAVSSHSHPRFFEIKAFDPSHGRRGINDGNQIRLLFNENTGKHRAAEEIQIIDASVRWIVGCLILKGISF